MASLLDKATKGRVRRPYLIALYGVDGVGKTKFACDSGNTVVVGTEEGAGRYAGTQVPKAKTYEDLYDTVQDLYSKKGAGFKGLVVDAMDGVEKLCEEKICRDNGTTAVEEIPYGKGVPMSHELFVRFVKLCESVREDHGLNVIFISHSHVKAMNDPTQPAAYDRHQLKLRDRNAAYLREIVEAVLFATYDTYVKTNKDGDKKGRGIGGEKRVMFSSRTAAYDAKNRDGLPHKMDLSWSSFDSAMNREDAELASGLKIECEELIAEYLAKNPEANKPLCDTMKKFVNDAGSNVERLREVLNRISTRVEG